MSDGKKYTFGDDPRVWRYLGTGAEVSFDPGNARWNSPTSVEFDARIPVEYWNGPRKKFAPKKEKPVPTSRKYAIRETLSTNSLDSRFEVVDADASWCEEAVATLDTRDEALSWIKKRYLLDRKYKREVIDPIDFVEANELGTFTTTT